MADIFSRINELSLSLQRRTMTVFDASHKVSAFKREIDYWAECTTKGKFECFPKSLALLEENYEQASTNIVNEIIEHLWPQQLKNLLEQYFPADWEVLLKNHEWVLNPFSVWSETFKLIFKWLQKLDGFNFWLNIKIFLQQQFVSQILGNYWNTYKNY